jgi:hypothetical protein
MSETSSQGRSPEQWLSLATLFVAPTSLITGLCYFFGLLSIRHRLQYFGVDPSALGYTSADYVVATIGTFFFAALRALLVCAVVLLSAVAVRRWAASQRHRTLLRVIAWGALGFGAVALGAAATWLVTDYPLIDKLLHPVIGSDGPVYTAWAIVAGIGGVTAGYRMLVISGGLHAGKTLPRNAERGLLAVAVTGTVVALFWITDMYAAEFGDRNGAYAATRLWPSDGNYTAVQLDTSDALNLPADLVKMSVLPGATPSYRYECLRVLEVHGGKFVLVPAKWQRDRGYAITVTPDSGHRITSVVRSAATGNDANVTPFWQCPEVVRTYQHGDLASALLEPPVVQTIVGGHDLTVRPTAVHPDPPSDERCAAALPVYPDESESVQQSETTGTSFAGTLWVRQRITTFPDAMAAANFMVATQSHWTDCAGATVSVHRSDTPQPRALSAPGTQDNILAVTDSPAGSTAADCATAVAAKSNVVIRVEVCGADQPLMAVGVASAIRDRIPV